MPFFKALAVHVAAFVIVFVLPSIIITAAIVAIAK